MSPESENTEIGSYFVANYPPFSVWSPDDVPAVGEAFMQPALPGTPLGLYLHIPFCRKRCKFCYFKVYTEKNSSDVDEYLSAITKEISLYAGRPGIGDRQFEFVYFGGGTPSYLSRGQLLALIDRIGEHWTWEAAKEVTFECEPGTLKKSKLEGIREIGATRLSLGIEHFDDDILALNGRAHRSPEIQVAYDCAREVGFDQINVDLIAGMAGDTDSKWKATVEKTLALSPESVTVYQMELPFNAVFSRESLDDGAEPAPVASWETKRKWLDYCFSEFEKEGYVLSSGYTLVRPPKNGNPTRFVYRDSLWHGADLIGTGVASFSHFGGVHYQNADRWEDYVTTVNQGELPVRRALKTTPRQRLIREMILQLKMGSLDAGYFRDKFETEIIQEFHDGFGSLVEEGFAHTDGDKVQLTRQGLLRVDALLPRFFDPEHRNLRYT